MRTLIKVTIGIVTSLIIIFVIGGYIFYSTLTASLPTYSGELIVPSIKEEVKIYFDKPQLSITPGQGAVFYRNNEVLGGGWIGEDEL